MSPTIIANIRSFSEFSVRKKLIELCGFHIHWGTEQVIPKAATRIHAVALNPADVLNVDMGFCLPFCVYGVRLCQDHS